ncbi:hypothetical protein [Legionella clemsonensis]|uniref:Uncharacterized protein n=1 Tax=Legionella clemsonensis TaxID=1867846 RepID=A0A222P4K6_9GAMM|nr:hypothetical protein [Legionella clemsonensis]ASQ46757.1 hypothetical protein clem_11055 [Legionella clemsonensis]
MKNIIKLIENLSDEDAGLLAKIGAKIENLEIEIPDTRYIYYKRNGRKYYIHCYDDANPVAYFFIKNSSWDPYQEVKIYKDRIDAALIRMASQQENAHNHREYPDFEERRKMIAKGDYLFLFNIPFAELRFDEQEIIKKRGFQRRGSETYHPLSREGQKLVKLIKSTKDELEFAQKASLFFSGREEAKSDHVQSRKATWKNLLDGKHSLTKGFSEEQIMGYFSIALKGVAPAGFQDAYSQGRLEEDEVKSKSRCILS